MRESSVTVRPWRPGVDEHPKKLKPRKWEGGWIVEAARFHCVCVYRGTDRYAVLDAGGNPIVFSNVEGPFARVCDMSDLFEIFWCVQMFLSFGHSPMDVEPPSVWGAKRVLRWIKSIVRKVDEPPQAATVDWIEQKLAERIEGIAFECKREIELRSWKAQG